MQDNSIAKRKNTINKRYTNIIVPHGTWIQNLDFKIRPMTRSVKSHTFRWKLLWIVYHNPKLKRYFLKLN